MLWSLIAIVNLPLTSLNNNNNNLLLLLLLLLLLHNNNYIQYY